MKKKITVAALGFMAASSMAYAEPGQWYLSPAMNYVIADSARETDDGAGVQLGIGQEVSKSFNIELVVEGDKLSREDGSGDHGQYGASLDALYFFNRDWTVAPYALIGAGMLRSGLDDNRETSPMGSVGAGVMGQITKAGTALRFEARYRHDEDNRDPVNNIEKRYGDTIVSLGLVVPVGSASTASMDDDGDGIGNAMDQCPGTSSGVQVDTNGCEVKPEAAADSDNDGVPDSSDHCPNTPAGVAIDAMGCAASNDSDGDGVDDAKDQCPMTPNGVKVDNVGCESDADGDGVADSQDRCEGTLAGVSVNATGCEPDTDADGIVNRLDQCPDSAAGEKVDSKGCKLEEKIVLKGVTFANGSADLVGDSERVLNDVSSTLLRHPELHIELAGYTDNRGAIGFNVRLSQRRAEAVRDYLVKQGIPKSHMTAKGYGPANPVADNNTKSGRAENRRVEMHVIK